MGREHATPDVKDALRDALLERSSKDLRRDAATALGLLRDAGTVKLLVDELKRAKSFTVQGQIILAIGAIGDHSAVDALIDILDNRNRPEATRAGRATIVCSTARSPPSAPSRGTTSGGGRLPSARTSGASKKSCACGTASPSAGSGARPGATWGATQRPSVAT